MKHSAKRVLSMSERRTARNWIVGLVGVSMLMLGVFAGVGVTLLLPKPELNDKSTQVSNFGEISVLPDSVINWTYKFESCGHTVNFTGVRGYVGQSVAEIAADYPNADITVNDDKSVAVNVTVDEYCPAHYLLVYTDVDTLCVFRTNAESFECEQLLELEIKTDTLDSAMVNQLSNGLAFDSLAAINAYLESIE